MTGFATTRGAAQLDGVGWEWSFDLRSVNHRGLDLKLRVPDWLEGLEPALRAALQQRLARGAISLTLRLGRAAGAERVPLDPAALAQAMAALAAVEAAAEGAGVTLQHSSAAQVLGLRGLLEPVETLPDPAALCAEILTGVPALLDALEAARGAEGAHLARALAQRLDRVAALIDEARLAAEARTADAGATLRASVERLLGAGAADPSRLAQELALLAVKGDVGEELDRLQAHLAAARALLSGPGPMGRRLDFLTQEFNREANTLCAKSGDATLTRVGLDLKVVIDQMREQVQNLE